MRKSQQKLCLRGTEMTVAAGVGEAEGDCGPGQPRERRFHGIAKRVQVSDHT